MCEQTNIETKTEPWTLESNLVVEFKNGGVEISVGGCQQPHYVVSGECLEDAIRELVKAVTGDAIEDEAREWLEAHNTD